MNNICAYRVLRIAYRVKKDKENELRESKEKSKLNLLLNCPTKVYTNNIYKLKKKKDFRDFCRIIKVY